MVERRSPKPDVVGSSPTWPVYINNSKLGLVGVVCCIQLRTIFFMYSVTNTCIIVYFLT